MRRRTARLLFAVLFIGGVLYVATAGPPASQMLGKRRLAPRLQKIPWWPGTWKAPWEKTEPAASGAPPVPGWLRPIEDKLVQPATREWRSIVVHHSAGPSGNAAEFDKFHREENHWENGLGYHFVIGNGNGSPMGCVEVGGRWLKQLQGAHAGTGATEYNEHGIGICVVGNYDEADFPGTAYVALRDLVEWLAKRYAIPPDRILPHRAVRLEPTECPGKNFPLDRLREDVRAALE